MRILILGLGWLGKDLAIRLAEAKHYVIGTKRNIDVPIHNIELISWSAEQILPINLSADICVITLTPSAISDLQKFEENLNLLLNNGVKKFIYTSSTGIYEGLEGIIDEHTQVNINTDRITKLYNIEQIVLKHKESVVLRLGGLVGDDRLPAKFLAGKKDISGAEQKINMVHKNDVINIIVLLLNSGYTGIMNVVASAHQSRKEYYTMLCERYQLEKPQFNNNVEKTRIVSNELSKKILNYQYEIDDTLAYFLS